MGQPRRNVRRMESSHTEEAKKFGGKLFEAVFSRDVWVCLRRSMEVAQRQDAGLRIRLQLTRDAQDLADLPWEYLYDRELNRFLALSTDTPVTRYLALPEPPRPLTVQPPLRVLVMISSPSDYPALDVEREWAVLQEALADVQRDGLVVAERLERPSLAALQRRLRRGQYHVFHFIGHGAFDDASQDGVLLLEDDDRRGHVVSGQELGTLLHDHRPLRLAIINACEGRALGQVGPVRRDRAEPGAAGRARGHRHAVRGQRRGGDRLLPRVLRLARRRLPGGRRAGGGPEVDLLAGARRRVGHAGPLHALARREDLRRRAEHGPGSGRRAGRSGVGRARCC